MRTHDELNALYEQAIEEVVSIGIIPGCIKTVGASAKLTAALGKCYRKRDLNVRGERTFEIKIAARALKRSVPDSFIKNVLIHEILHTVDGCFNHGENWKREAGRVNNTYPQYHITRCEDSATCQALGVDRLYKREYVPFRCEKCGYEYRASRRSKFVKAYREYTHKGCGGRFEKIEAPKSAISNMLEEGDGQYAFSF